MPARIGEPKLEADDDEGRRRGRPVGRPPRISRGRVVDAVLEMGIDRATIAGVAERLGVDPSTLYGHVDSRDHMLAVAADAAVARARWPSEAEGDWRAFLTAIADSLWRLYRDHPGLAVHLRGMQSIPPALMARSAQVVATLRERFGLDVFQAALVTDTVGDTVIDSFLTIARLEGPSTSDPHRTQRDRALDALDPDGAPAPQDYVTVLHEALGSPGGAEDWWREKVQLVLDGLAFRLERTAAG